MKRAIRTQAVCVDDGYIWIYLNTINALLKMNPITKEHEYVTSFKNKLYDDALYTDIFCHNRKLFFIPYRASDIAVYHIETGMVEYISFHKELIAYNAIRYEGSKVLLFPKQDSDEVWILDLSKECAYSRKIDFLFDKSVLSDKGLFLYMGESCNGKNATFIVPVTNYYIEYDMEKNTARLAEFSDDDEYYFAYSLNGNQYYMNIDGTRVLVKDSKECEKQYNIPYNNKYDLYWENKPMAYSSLAIAEGYALCVPAKNNDIYRLDEGVQKLGNLNWDNIKNITHNARVFSSIVIHKNEILLFPYNCDTLVIYNCESDDYTYIAFELSDEEINEIIQGNSEIILKMYEEGEIVEGTNGIDLKTFLACL